MTMEELLYIYIYIYIYERSVVWKALESIVMIEKKSFRNKSISTYFLFKILRKHFRNLVKPIHDPQKC